MKIITLSFIILVSTQCFASGGSKTYTIERGEHSSKGLHIALFNSNELRFVAEFNSSAIYDLGNANQGDINKLAGFSDCTSAHQKNSARLGWRWFNDQLEILAYSYKNGLRSHKFIKTINIDSKHRYSIKVKGNKYLFTVDSTQVSLERKCDRKKAFGYRLSPYFGGDEVAPHEVSIFIDYSK